MVSCRLQVFSSWNPKLITDFCTYRVRKDRLSELEVQIWKFNVQLPTLNFISAFCLSLCVSLANE